MCVCAFPLQARGLYKGMASPLLGMAAINAIVFGVYGSCMRLMEGNSSNGPDLVKSYIAGSAAGLVQSVICCPTELIKLRMQVQGIGQDEHRPRRKLFGGSTTISSSSSSSSSYHGPWQTTKNIYHKEGIRGLYRGMGSTVLREVPAFGAYFLTYDGLCTLMASTSGQPIDQLNPFALCLAGGFSGISAWVVTYPVDVVKSRLQVDGVAGKMEYSGMVDCFRKSYHAEGPRVFVKGLNSTMLRAFPVNAATFCTVTLMLRYWQKWSPLD